MSEFARSRCDFIIIFGSHAIDFADFPILFRSSAPTRLKKRRLVKHLKKHCGSLRNQGLALARMLRKSSENGSERASRASSATEGSRTSWFCIFGVQQLSPRCPGAPWENPWASSGTLLAANFTLFGSSWVSSGHPQSRTKSQGHLNSSKNC